MWPPSSKLLEPLADRGLMARSLMYLFASGGAISLVALTRAGHGDMPMAATCAAATWSVVGLLLAGYDGLPDWSFHVLVAGGTGLVDWAIAASGAGAAYAPLLIALAVYAVCFFRAPAAVAQVGLMVAGYALAARGRLPFDGALIAAAGLGGAACVAGFQRAAVNRLVARLKDVARTDPLTGLLNRRGFEELIETELERSRRSGRPLSLIVGDLDHFKQLNDRFGHAAGDRALEQLSLIIDTTKRRIDTAARIGGEEIAVILPDSDQHAAYILAERMRREVRNTFAGEPHELTVSLGVATFPNHASDVETLVARADESLYAAKALGRDRTALYSDALEGAVLDAGASPGAHGEPPARTVLALAEVLDRRGSSSDAHSQTVGRYAASIARELGLPDELIERVRFGGIVHDIGKLGVPESVLSKPTWLSAEDWFELRRHPEIGAEILSSVELHDVSEWVRAHHERPDGTGYPDGLAGTDIPLEARILAVADAYESMTSDRVYRAALTPDEARAELLRGCGTQFDAHVVEAFVQLLDARAIGRPLRLAR